MRAKYARQLADKYQDPTDLPSLLSVITHYSALGFTNLCLRYDEVNQDLMNQFKSKLISFNYKVFDDEKGLDIQW